MKNRTLKAMPAVRAAAVLCGVLAGATYAAGGPPGHAAGQAPAHAPARAPGAGDAPVAGQNLAWCIRGIHCWALGRASNDDLLELAGGVMAYLSCR